LAGAIVSPLKLLGYSAMNFLNQRRSEHPAKPVAGHFVERSLVEQLVLDIVLRP